MPDRTGYSIFCPVRINLFQKRIHDDCVLILRSTDLLVFLARWTIQKIVCPDALGEILIKVAHSRADQSKLTPLSHRFWSFLAWRYPLGRNLEIQNFLALGPLGGVLWAFQNWWFLGTNIFWMAITSDLQMIESWFWYQTSGFGTNFLKKVFKNFFGPKKTIF